MIGYKQAYTLDYNNIVIVKLDIPDYAKIVHVKTYGCARDFYYCDKAKVVSITSFDCKHQVKKAVSMKDHHFKYTVGEEVKAEFDRSVGQRGGIYFFRTRKQAKEYEY